MTKGCMALKYMLENGYNLRVIQAYSGRTAM